MYSASAIVSGVSRFPRPNRTCKLLAEHSDEIAPPSDTILSEKAWGNVMFLERIYERLAYNILRNSSKTVLGISCRGEIYKNTVTRFVVCISGFIFVFVSESRRRKSEYHIMIKKKTFAVEWREGCSRGAKTYVHVGRSGT